MKKRYAKQWYVVGSSGTKYKVSLTLEGVYQCSCPRWKFRREQCRHIQDVIGGGYNKAPLARPAIILSMISEPTLSADGLELFIPLLRFGDIHMQATICCALLDVGYNIAEIREIRNLPKEWTADMIREHVRIHGKVSYPAETAKKKAAV